MKFVIVMDGTTMEPSLMHIELAIAFYQRGWYTNCTEDWGVSRYLRTIIDLLLCGY